MRTLVLAISIGALTTACATALPYQVRHRYIPASKSELLAAALAISKEQRWTVLEVDPGAGRIQVLTPIEQVVGVDTRQRWSFEAKDGVAYARLTFEARFDQGENAPWVRSDGVYAGYEYMREEEQLEKLARRVWDVQLAFQ